MYFLCYGSFTAQAAKTLKAAFETAENVTGIFVFGKEDLYTGSSRRSFLRAAEEYYAEKGDTKSKVRISDMGAPIGGAAEVLRRGIFDPSSFSGANEPYKTDAIRIFEAEDKTGRNGARGGGNQKTPCAKSRASVSRFRGACIRRESVCAGGEKSVFRVPFALLFR